MPKIKNWKRVPTDNGNMWKNDETGAEVHETLGNRGTGRTVWLEFSDGSKLTLDINKKERMIRHDYIHLELKRGTEMVHELKVSADVNDAPSKLGRAIAIDYMRGHPKGKPENEINRIARSSVKY